MFSQLSCSNRFCVEDTAGNAFCRDTAAPACASALSFVCTSAGVFPDPLDCKKYYFCSTTLVPTNMLCPDLYVFDPSRTNNNYCRFTRNKYCTKVSCGTTTRNIVMAFKWFPIRMGSYIAACQGSATVAPRMYRCAAGFSPLLSQVPVLCNLICNGPARGEDTSDPTRYFECVFNGSKWVQQSNSCGPNEKFNASTNKCA